MTTTTLREDLLRSLQEISEYTGEPERRLRHMIDHHGFPAKKSGGKIQSRKSWIDRFYAEPDEPASKNGGE
jgi:hypothetical protein